MTQKEKVVDENKDINVSKDRILIQLFEEARGYDAMLTMIAKHVERTQRNISDLVKEKYKVTFFTHIYDSDRKVLRLRKLGE